MTTEALIIIIISAFFAVVIGFAVKLKFFSSRYVDANNVIGAKCIVAEIVDNHAGCGQVDVLGQNWSARSASDEDVFQIGETLRVVAIEGAKLICMRL